MTVLDDVLQATRIGITGTRHGMSGVQRATLYCLLKSVRMSTELHHGDCLGVDAEAHELANDFGLRTVIHPPADEKLRAWCHGDIVLPRKPYLERNRDIVDACDVLLAFPFEEKEQDRGGTWYTVRYARETGVPCLVGLPRHSSAEHNKATCPVCTPIKWS
jgi:hypothetical protein